MMAVTGVFFFKEFCFVFILIQITLRQTIADDNLEYSIGNKFCVEVSLLIKSIPMTDTYPYKNDYKVIEIF